MKSKKILSLLLTIAMVLSVVMPTGALAEETAPAAENYGFVINDTFDDSTACGWISGAGNAVTVTPMTIEGTGEKVIKVEMPVISTLPTWVANGQQSTVTKGLDNIIPFTGNNIVRIKARVKNVAANDTYMIKVNRPNAVSSGLPLSCAGTFSYMVAGFDTGKPGFGIGLSAANAKYKSFEAFANKADGTVFDYTDVDLTNTWIDYTVVINGATNEQRVTASFEYNGETVTLYSTSKSTFIQPADAYTCAGREGETTFVGFERLTFASKDSTDGATIYIDSVSVENLPLTNIKAEVIPNDGELIYKPETLDIKFNGDINYVEGGIVIRNKDTDDEYTNGTYNAETKTYTANFGGMLAQGNYELDLTAITPVDHLPSDGITPVFENTVIDFRVYTSKPPTLNSVVIEGRLVPDTGVLSVKSYDFQVENDTEGTHHYQWLMSDTINGSYTEIDSETGATLSITQELSTKYIRLRMAVKGAASGLPSNEVESNILIPEAKPVIDGLKLDTTFAIENKEVSALYKYSDANDGDTENGTEIKWYVSDTDALDDAGHKVGEGESYTITSNDRGKYIYCTVIPKNDAEYLGEGDLYTSTKVGPIVSETEFLASLNLLQNPGFEDGINHYSVIGQQWDPNIEALSGEARTGNGSLRLHKRPAPATGTDLALHAAWGQEVAVQGNKRYIASCYAKAINGTISNFNAYGSGMSLLDEAANGPGQGVVNLTTNDFQHVVHAVVTSPDATTARVGFTSFASRAVCDANIDDMYFAELYIADFNVNKVEQIKIPKEGETRITLTNGEIYNQLGTRHGLYDQSVVIEIPTTAGVQVDGHDLVITNAAQEGELEVSVVVRPTYLNPIQSAVIKTFKIQLFPYNTPMKPQVKELRVSTTIPVIDDEVFVDYVYVDENENEPENGTEIKWYVSDTDALDDAGQEVGTGKTYKITSTDENKYIYCTVIPKNDAAVLGEGDLYTSAKVGPVSTKAGLLDNTNLLKNPSFEDELEHYSVVGNWTPNIEPLYGEARTGDISLRLHKRSTDASLHAYWGQDVAVEAGKRYVAGCYALSVDSNKRTIEKFYPYIPGLTSTDTYVTGKDENGKDITENRAAVNVSAIKFTKIAGGFDATEDAVVKVGFTSFTSRSICDANVDDLYFGELYISDFNTNYTDRISIPAEGEKKVALTNGEIYNQLGTRHGLYDQDITIEIPATKGVYVDGYNLVVTEEASAGTIVADIVVRPTYAGATQSEIKKQMTIELLSHGNSAPRVTDVVISGTFGAGNTLTGTYKFLQVDGKADNSSIQWMYADEFNGTYNAIPGANASSYIVDSIYADKFICMEVTPVADDGSAGTPVRSNVLTKERAPFMESIEISGNFIVGGTLTATGKVCDYNGLTGSETMEYQWYISESAEGIPVAVAGADTETFVLDASHTGKYIRVGITPVSTVAPQRGGEYLSNAYAGPAVPVATNVSITKSGLRLTAQYTYTHIHGIKEKDTTYEWSVDGRIVSTASDYTVNFEGTKTVTLAVTPRAEFEPRTGATVYKSVTLTGSSGGSGGSGGGGYIGGGSGGGGGGSTGGGSSSGGSVSGVTSVNDMTLTDPSKEVPEVKTDIRGHWGETYIKEMEKDGVMTADENGNFNPDKNVSRESMLTFLFKALKLEETEYKNEFNDIADGDFAKMLQTMVDNGTIAKDENFRPNDTITREEMCKILYVSLKNAGKLTESDTMVIEGFEDFNAVSDWAKVYVNAIYSNKIMVGISDTHFDPKGTVTKAQAATMLVRINRLIEGGAEK